MQLSTNQNDMRCTVCRAQKFELRPRKSRLMRELQMFLCNECFANKREPRFAIILVGQQAGLSAVDEYLRNRRYVGEEILARDLLV